MTDDDDNGEFERWALDITDKIAQMTDAELRDAYLAIDGDHGGVWEDALALTLYERGIDV